MAYEPEDQKRRREAREARLREYRRKTKSMLLTLRSMELDCDEESVRAELQAAQVVLHRAYATLVAKLGGEPEDRKLADLDEL